MTCIMKPEIKKSSDKEQSRGENTEINYSAVKSAKPCLTEVMQRKRLVREICCYRQNKGEFI